MSHGPPLLAWERLARPLAVDNANVTHRSVSLSYTHHAGEPATWPIAPVARAARACRHMLLMTFEAERRREARCQKHDHPEGLGLYLRATQIKPGSKHASASSWSSPICMEPREDSRSCPQSQPLEKAQSGQTPQQDKHPPAKTQSGQTRQQTSSSSAAVGWASPKNASRALCRTPSTTVLAPPREP